ncbi:MAG: general secretion pathway protein GspK [Gammaproteobacteria bacterium]
MAQKGFALVLVLWVLSLLTIMAGSFALTMRREAAIVTGSSTNAQAMAIAESGLAVAELMLINPDQRQRWHTDGSIYQIDYTGSKIRIRLLAETGKVDINSADQALLQELMSYAPVQAEVQNQLVNAILDWRDTDDLVRIEGAEKREYKAAGLTYQPRNKPFQSVEELQLVLGMDEHVYQWLEGLVTVYSGQPKVNLTQAAKEVLQVLPELDEGLIEGFIAARRESAINGLLGRSGTGASIAGNNAPAATAVNNETEQKAAITVVVEALLDDGTTAIIKALIKRSDKQLSTPFQVLKWQRNPATDGSLFANDRDQFLVGQYGEPEFNN